MTQFEEFFKETLVQFDAGAHAEGSVASIFRVIALLCVTCGKVRSEHY